MVELHRVTKSSAVRDKLRLRLIILIAHGEAVALRHEAQSALVACQDLHGFLLVRLDHGQLLLSSLVL